MNFNKCCDSPSYSDQGSKVFPDAKIVDGLTTDTGTAGNWSFWLSAQGTSVGSWVQVDLGGLYSISGVNLLDTDNRWYDDRGTQAFTHDQWLNQTPLSLGNADTARYVRFTVDACWGCRSAGLAEMQVFGAAALAPAWRWMNRQPDWTSRRAFFLGLRLGGCLGGFTVLYCVSPAL